MRRPVQKLHYIMQKHYVLCHVCKVKHKRCQQTAVDRSCSNWTVCTTLSVMIYTYFDVYCIVEVLNYMKTKLHWDSSIDLKVIAFLMLGGSCEFWVAQLQMRFSRFLKCGAWRVFAPEASYTYIHELHVYFRICLTHVCLLSNNSDIDNKIYEQRWAINIDANNNTT